MKTFGNLWRNYGEIWINFGKIIGKLQNNVKNY